MTTAAPDPAGATAGAGSTFDEPQRPPAEVPAPARAETMGGPIAPPGFAVSPTSRTSPGVDELRREVAELRRLIERVCAELGIPIDEGAG